MKPKKGLYKHKIAKGDEMELNISSGTFVPTGTTTSLIKAVSSYIRKPGRMLDLGCGSGIVGIYMHRKGLVKGRLCASDLSSAAVDCAVENAKIHRCPIEAKCGELFEPWGGERFDYIVDDVSGVSEEIAGFSPWFRDVPCASGPDGTLLVTEVLNKAPAYLKKLGCIFFPVVSFSNAPRIVKEAGKNFSSVRKLAHEEWPLPGEMCKNISALKRLKKKGWADFVEKFGMILWYTDIYCAHNR